MSLLIGINGLGVVGRMWDEIFIPATGSTRVCSTLHGTRIPSPIDTFRSYFLKLMWPSFLLSCLLYLTVNCFNIPVHSSYQPKNLPFSIQDSKKLIRGIDFFTFKYAISQGDRFESLKMRSKVYKETRLLALHAFHPTAEIRYTIPNSPIFEVQIGKREVDYAANYNTSHLEFIKIREGRNNRANIVAIEAMKRSMRVGGVVRNDLHRPQRPKLSKTAARGFNSYYYDFKVMKSYYPEHTYPWTTKTIVRALALNWSQREERNLLNMQDFAQFLLKNAFPGSIIVDTPQLKRTGKARIIRLFKQSIDTAIKCEPLLSYTLEAYANSSFDVVYTVMLPGKEHGEHNYVVLHSFETDALYDVTTMHSKVTLIRFPKMTPVIKSVHPGILTRISLPFHPKGSTGFDHEVNDHINKARIKFATTSRTTQRKIVHASKTFDELATLIFGYITDPQMSNDILNLHLRKEVEVGLLEPFDNGIIYTVGDELFKREFDKRYLISFEGRLWGPTSISASADGSIAIINCGGDHTYVCTGERLERQIVSCGLVSSDGKAILHEYSKGRINGHQASSLTYLIVFSLFTLFNMGIPSLPAMVVVSFMGLFFMGCDILASITPSTATTDDDLPCTVLKNAKGDILKTWKGQRLRSASPNFESIVLASARGGPPTVVSRFPGYILQNEVKLPHWSDTVFMRLEVDALNTDSFKVGAKNILAIYSFTGECRVRNVQLYRKCGIPLTTTFDELLDYSGVYQVRECGLKMMFIHKVNGKKQVQFKSKLPTRDELANILGDVLVPK